MRGVMHRLLLLGLLLLRLWLWRGVSRRDSERSNVDLRQQLASPVHSDTSKQSA